MRKISYLLLALLAFVFISGCFGSKEKAEGKSEIKTVSSGYIEELKKQYAGKTIVVNFFASWCPPCRGETPDFVEAYEKFKGDDFVIIGISVDKSPEDAQKFVDEYKITYPVVHGDNSLGMQLSVNTIPVSFIYKPDGSLFDRAEGPLTANQLEYIATKLK